MPDNNKNNVAGSFRDNHGDDRCSACGQYVDVCKEYGCNPPKTTEPLDMSDYAGPDNPNGLTEVQIEDEDRQFLMLRCLQSLLYAAGASDLEFDEATVGLTFGKRSLTFETNRFRATFAETKDRNGVYICLFHVHVDGQITKHGKLSEAKFVGLSHHDIFSFYFEGVAEAVSL